MRGEILNEAHKIINGERQDQYGNPEDCFSRIAELWSAYLQYYEASAVNLKPADVALMMVLFKIARWEHKGNRDSMVDAAGYLGIAGDMWEGKS